MWFYFLSYWFKVQGMMSQYTNAVIPLTVFPDSPALRSLNMCYHQSHAVSRLCHRYANLLLSSSKAYLKYRASAFRCRNPLLLLYVACRRHTTSLQCPLLDSLISQVTSLMKLCACGHNNKAYVKLDSINKLLLYEYVLF